MYNTDTCVNARRRGEREGERKKNEHISRIIKFRYDERRSVRCPRTHEKAESNV